MRPRMSHAGGVAMVMLASHAECRIEHYSEREDNKDKRYGLNDILCLLLLLGLSAGTACKSFLFVV